jgi:uncharacterized protein YndB with AHSA1/START domain
MPTITSSLTINASSERVFDLLTNPQLTKLWQHGRELITEWKTGEPIRFRTEWTGGLLEQWGTVLEIRPNELVKYNLFTPRPGDEDRIENYCTTSYVLTSENDHTRVEIIQEDNRPNAFTPATLMPILVALRKAAEGNE